MKLKRVANIEEYPEYIEEKNADKDMTHSAYLIFETNEDGSEITRGAKNSKFGETDEERYEFYRKLIENLPEGVKRQTVKLFDFETDEETFVKRYYAIYKNEEHSMFEPNANDSISSGNMTPAKVTVELYFNFDECHRYVTKEYKTRNCNIWTLVEGTIDNYKEELPIKFFETEDSPDGDEGNFILCYDEFYNEHWINIQDEYEIKDALVSFRLVDVKYLFDETK